MNTNVNITDNRNATCYALAINLTEFAEGSSLRRSIPILMMQIALSMAVNMGFNVALQPLHPPRVVPDMLGGFMLSPALLDTLHPGLGSKLWPRNTMEILRSLVNLGLIFAMFIAGVNINLPPFNQLGKRTSVIASLATILPMVLGAVIIFPLLTSFGDDAPKATFYWVGLISSSSFASLAPWLTRLKLVYTNLGREALSVGLFNELWSWCWVLLAIALSAGRKDAMPGVFGFMVIFTAICFIFVRPIVGWITKRKPEGEGFDDATINVVLFVVLACGLVSEMCGVYSLFGAFTLGLAMPQGLLATTTIEKMDDFITGVLMPLYYSLTGIKLSFDHLIKFPQFWSTLIIPLLAKTLSFSFASLFVKMAPRDAIGLGLLFSSKGLLAMVLITIGFERKHLPPEAFTEQWLSILVSSALVTPLISLLYYGKRINNPVPYIHRTIQGLKPNDDFHILVNIHAPPNIHGIINLLEISDIAPTCPMSVFAVRIVELIGRGSSMFVIHDSRDSSSSKSWLSGPNPFLSRGGSQSSHFITAFQNYAENHSASTTVKSMTILCPANAMHEEICSVAEDQRAALVILSFHKQQTMEGRLEETEPEFGPVIQNTMDNAPCSVGLLVDKGFGALPLGQRMSASSSGRLQVLNEVKIGMIFIGGRDDREALTLAWRFAAHHLVTLSVMRFLVGDHAVDVEPVIDGFSHDEDEDEPFTILTCSEKEKELDVEYIDLFRQRTQNDKAIKYIEKVSNSGDETVGILREMEHNYDLYIVGRGRSAVSPLTVGLAEWSESPELGAVGEVLVTSDFSSHVSVLVVQQHSSATTYSRSKDDHNVLSL